MVAPVLSLVMHWVRNLVNPVGLRLNYPCSEGEGEMVPSYRLRVVCLPATLCGYRWLISMWNLLDVVGLLHTCPTVTFTHLTTGVRLQKAKRWCMVRSNLPSWERGELPRP